MDNLENVECKNNNKPTNFPEKFSLSIHNGNLLLLLIRMKYTHFPSSFPSKRSKKVYLIIIIFVINLIHFHFFVC